MLQNRYLGIVLLLFNTTFTVGLVVNKKGTTK